MKKFKIIAATGCPTGIAHTFMAEEALKQAAAKLGVEIKVETHGQIGVQNELSPEDIKQADGVIVAADKDVGADRFAGKRVLDVPVARGIRDAESLIRALLNGEAPIYREQTATKTEDELQTGEAASIGRKIYKHLMNGVSHMLPFVVGGGVLIALSFLFGIHSADPEHPSYNAFAELLNKTGAFGFQLMVPILSAYIAASMAKRPGLIVGFIGGMIASTGGAGFLGGIVSGFLAGLIIYGLSYALKKCLNPLKG